MAARWRPVLVSFALWLLILSPLASFDMGIVGGDEIQKELDSATAIGRIGDGVGQTFRAERDRLAGVGIPLETVGGAGRAEWEFVLASSTGEPLHSGHFSSRRRWGRRILWFRFPPIPESAGRRYIFWMRKLPGGGERALAAFGSREDAYRNGGLFIDGRALEGDLAFLTRYSRPRLDRLQIPPPTPDHRPPWFAGPPIPILTAGLLGIALFFVVLFLVVKAFDPLPLWAVAVVTAVALSAILVLVPRRPAGTFALEPGGPGFPWMAPGSDYRLTDRYSDPQTEIRQGGGLIFVKEDLAPGEPERVIVMHPDTRGSGPPLVVFQLRLPEKASFRFTPWITAVSVEKGSDGAVFGVAVREPGEPEQNVYRAYFGARALRDASPVEVDLSPWSGKTIGLVLQTFPGPADSSFWDLAGWGDPIVHSRP